MTKLTWRTPSISSGVDKGVLYSASSAPVAWSGITNVTEKPVDDDLTISYFDGQKYVQHRSSESFEATVEAYSYPSVMDEHGVFNFTYRVLRDDGYEIHLVYNAKAVISDESWSTLNSETDLLVFSWDISTIPTPLTQYRSTSHLIVDSAHSDPLAIAEIENKLYGTSLTDPTMPTMAEMLAIFDKYKIFTIVDNGDGTWTATGPDSWFTTIDSTTVQINSPSIETLDENSYRIRSW